MDAFVAITVEDFDVVEAEGSSGCNEGRGFVSNLSDDIRSRLHITVGTKSGDGKPVEAKTMVQKWRRGKEQDKIKSFKLVGLIVYGRIKGLMAYTKKTTSLMGASSRASLSSSLSFEPRFSGTK